MWLLCSSAFDLELNRTNTDITQCGLWLTHNWQRVDNGSSETLCHVLSVTPVHPGGLLSLGLFWWAANESSLPTRCQLAISTATLLAASSKI